MQVVLHLPQLWQPLWADGFGAENIGLRLTQCRTCILWLIGSTLADDFFYTSARPGLVFSFWLWPSCLGLPVVDLGARLAGCAYLF